MSIWQCKRCGKCCLTIPCVFARVRYHLTSKSEEVCPELVRDSGGYRCLLIERDAEARDVLLSEDCDDPAFAHLKKKLDVMPIVKEYFPTATKEEIENILWSHTGYPEFWNIPQDGWSALQCLRKQLKELLNSSTSGIIKINNIPEVGNAEHQRSTKKIQRKK